MKRKPTRNKGGRKKFSAGKLLGPDKSLQDNLALAATGEFGCDAQSREIFGLVATWKELSALPAKPAGKQYADARRELQARRAANAREALLRIFAPALDRLDPKPFETFIKAIALAKDLNRSGAILRDAHEVLRVAFEMGLELGDNVIQTVSPKAFKDRLRWRIAERQFARIKKQIGLHFTSGRPKA